VSNLGYLTPIVEMHINGLNKQIDDLMQQRDEARRRLKMGSLGYLSGVNKEIYNLLCKIDKLQAEILKLTKERDDARKKLLEQEE
jgi:predicted  nucleic acid-binding Zn-ribbon protein